MLGTIETTLVLILAHMWGLPVEPSIEPGCVSTVSNFAELAAAIQNEETIIELATNTVVVTEDLSIAHDCVIRPASHIKHVRLDLNGNRITIIDSNCAIGRPSIDSRLSFLNGRDNIWVTSTGDATRVAFYNCSFNDSLTGNGLSMRVGAHRLIVECFNCEANYNFADGYKVHNVSQDPGFGTLILVGSDARFNDPSGNGSPYGDGVTAHASNHEVYIVGGDFSHNSKGGATMVWGSRLDVAGNAEFLNNGSVIDLGDVYMADGGLLTWSEAKAGTIWLRASTFDLRSGQISDSIICDEGANLNIFGFGFEVSGLTHTGYFQNWDPFRIKSADLETAESITSITVPIPGDFNENG